MSEGPRRVVWAVVPVKAFERGKSRLGRVLSDPMRTAFARSLFDHVAQTLLGASSIAGVIVVTDDQAVQARAEELGLAVVLDPAGAALSAVVDAGVQAALGRGASAVFVCMADLPRMRASEVDAVTAALVDHSVAVVPDLHDAGTNVLCVAKSGTFASCFGRADSFQQHLTRARQRGLSTLVLRLPGLCFDVDGPEDLQDIA